jgi:hypothetical protein
MWFTSYFEGVAPTFEERISTHAKGIQRSIESIASALGEPAAWSRQSSNIFTPVSTDQNIRQNINSPNVQRPQSAQIFQNYPQQDYGSQLENILWQ